MYSCRTMSHCVFLWSPPRSISTAFELSIRQLSGVKCYHEPFMEPFFIGPARTTATHSFDHIPTNEEETLEAAFKRIQQDLKSDNFDAVFAKTLSLFLDSRHDMLLMDGLKSAKHTFLIRHPAHVGLSFKRLLDKRGFQLNPRMMSFKPTYDIYKYVKDNLRTDPVVINMDNGLLNPEGMLEKYCEATGLIYKPGMATKWESQFTLESMGANPLFCSGSHTSALQSTGLTQLTSMKPLPTDEELPEVIKKAIPNEMRYYEELKSVALI